MLATAPAALLAKDAPWRTGTGGSIWSGEMGIAGSSRVEWQFAPIRSLTRFGLAADWQAVGERTALTGDMLRQGDSVQLNNVRGTAGANWVLPLLGNLPFTCDFDMEVSFDRISVGGTGQAVHGRARGLPGGCTAKSGGAAVAIPALSLNAEHIGTSSRIRLSRQTQQRQTLVEATLTQQGQITVNMTAAGADMLPFTGIPAGSSVRF